MNPTLVPVLASAAVSLTFGFLFAGSRIRRRSERVRVAEALHELRRPLQAMALAEDREAMARQLELVLPALDDLEVALGGQLPRWKLRRLALRPLVEAAVGRWQLCAHDSAPLGGGVELRWHAGEVRAIADPRRLAQAIDNLIANAVEHGDSTVRVDAVTGPAGFRLSVRNRVRDEGDRRNGSTPPARDGWSRGHGLGIVSAIAAAHGGRFLFDCTAGWAIGTLEIPLAGRAIGTSIAS